MSDKMKIVAFLEGDDSHPAILKVAADAGYEIVDVVPISELDPAESLMGSGVELLIIDADAFTQINSDGGMDKLFEAVKKLLSRSFKVALVVKEDGQINQLYKDLREAGIDLENIVVIAETRGEEAILGAFDLLAGIQHM